MVAPAHNDVSRQLSRQTRVVREAYDDAVERLGGRGGERVLRDGLRSVFSQLTSEARSLTPRRTGNLRRNIDVRPGTARQRREDFFHVRFGFFQRRAPYRQTLAVEFGNRNVREHSPLRRAWRSNQDEAVRNAGAALAEEINRLAAELAAKLRRSR